MCIRDRNETARRRLDDSARSGAGAQRRGYRGPACDPRRVSAAGSPRCVPLMARDSLRLFGLRVLLRFGDQLLDFLTAFVSDLLVEIRTITFLHDPAAFLADRFVELRTVPLARRLTTLAPDLFVKPRAVPVTNGIAAFFTGLTHRHLAVDFFRPRFGCGLLGVGHASAGRFRRALQLLSALCADLFIERRAVLALRRLAAFAADGFVELAPILGLDSIAAALPGLANAHSAARRRRHVVVGRRIIKKPPELSAHRLSCTRRQLGKTLLRTILERPRVYDGLGGTPYTTDIAVADGKIVAIGDLSEHDAHERVDCEGFALAPGFIDVHSHSDELWLVNPRCESKILQGVTTEIAGNCGNSVAPLAGLALEQKRRNAAGVGLDVQWTTFDAFFSLIEREGVALNVASLVGLGTTRLCAAGPDARRLERDELEAQNRLIRSAIEEGALGVSSGLIYEPGRYADLVELIACAGAARDAGAPLYASHVRDEADDVEDAIAEALAVGERAEVAVQCSHHKAAGKKNWGKVHRTLAAIDRAS